MASTINASTTLGLVNSADTSGVLQLQTANTTAVTIDASQNVGVGTTTMTRNFNIGGSNAGVGLNLNNTGTSGRSFTINSTNSSASVVGVLGFYDDTASAYRMVIDSSGNLGVGTTSPSQRLDATVSSGAEGSGLAVTNSLSGGFGSGITFYSVRSDTSAKLAAAQIKIEGGAAWNSNATTSSAMVFSTINANTFAERARFDPSGNLLVGTTTVVNPNPGISITPGSGSQMAIGHGNGQASGTYYAYFVYNGTVIGSVTQSGTTAVLYNVTSDQRLKENIVDAPEFGSVIDSIQVRSYDWKADGTHQRAGFIAQELVTVAPEAVHQPADPEEMMAVDYSKLVPMLVKELQSMRQRLAVLEGK